MDCGNGAGTRINSFALVAYLPEALGEYLDRLRAELVTDCCAKAHLTVLPPRPLLCPPDEAWQKLNQKLQDVQPFRVELGEIELFPVTQVIYLSVLKGGPELERLHVMARRWHDFPGPRQFTVDHLTFVQNTLENRWTDLRNIPLSTRVPT